MRGKSYLSVGSVSMGIAGSIVDPDFFQDYLGMRNEFVDMSEIARRIEEKIYSEAEFRRALEWVKANCKEGPDINPAAAQHTRERKDKAWATSVKMAMIVRDLMVGNPDLKRKGLVEESLGHNAILAGFQGQRAWTDHLPNGDFLETILNSSFDWNGIRAALRRRHRERLASTASPCSSATSSPAPRRSSPTCAPTGAPRRCERVTGWKPSGDAAGGFIHLINSGATTLDGTGKQRKDGKAGHEALLGDLAPKRPAPASTPRAGATPTSATSAAAATPRTSSPRAA